MGFYGAGRMGVKTAREPGAGATRIYSKSKMFNTYTIIPEDFWSNTIKSHHETMQPSGQHLNPNSSYSSDKSI